jgi:hypothetical protein
MLHRVMHREQKRVSVALSFSVHAAGDRSASPKRLS